MESLITYANQESSDNSSKNVVLIDGTDGHPKTQSISSNQNASIIERIVEESK